MSKTIFREIRVVRSGSVLTGSPAPLRTPRPLLLIVARTPPANPTTHHALRQQPNAKLTPSRYASQVCLDLGLARCAVLQRARMLPGKPLGGHMPKPVQGLLRNVRLQKGARASKPI